MDDRLLGLVLRHLERDGAQLRRSLRPKYRTAILTNSFDGARREEARRLGFHEDFDPLVYSHEVGMAKPDPRVFEYTLKALGCSAREVAFIDDRSENVEAASALGIRAMQHIDTVSTLAWFDRLLDRA
ncbi:MAG: HAD-IA family hydrolase [Kineosporiaceae bacterium]